MLELVKYLITELVDNKEQVHIELKSQQDTDVYVVRVDQSDIGKIIGRQGKIASAIRTILRAAGNRQGKRCALEIVDTPDNTD